MEVSVVTLDDTLAAFVVEINQAAWDDANDISTYEEGMLRAYLQRQDTIFVACHDASSDRQVLMGIASARIAVKSYGNELCLYVDELGVCVDQRQKGAGKLIMGKVLDIAKENGCKELWLATGVDNHAANALYKSLEPDDVSEVIGYTYKTVNY